MNDSKPFYTSKLFWLGFATLLAPVLEWATGQDVISGNPWALFAIGALTVLFRSVTTNAIRILPVLLLAMCFASTAQAIEVPYPIPPRPGNDQNAKIYSFAEAARFSEAGYCAGKSEKDAEHLRGFIQGMMAGVALGIVFVLCALLARATRARERDESCWRPHRWQNVMPALLALLLLPAVAQAQLVTAGKAELLRRALPPTTDPNLDKILRDQSTLLYTEDEMPQLFQRGGAFRRVVRGNRNDGNDEFPWRTAGGVHRSTGIGSFRFLSLPASSNGVKWPVVIVQQKLDDRDQQAGLVWYFPVGTVIGEVLTMRSPAGADYTFEIRTRERESDDWGVEIYRPFPTSQSLADGIKALRPSWETDPALRDAVSRLESPRAMNVLNLTDRRLHPGFVLNINEAVDELPALDAKLVSELLLAATFEPSSAEFWRHGTNGTAAFSPTVRQGFSIVPANYDAGFLGNSRESCINCHRNTGAQSVRFDPTWSGHIRGSDGIFSFHPVSLESINQNPPRLRQELVSAGVIARFDPAIHPESVYTSIPKLRHLK